MNSTDAAIAGTHLKKSGGFQVWSLMPIALLGSLGTGLAVMISIAVHDPGFAVEPGYYQQALNWDAHRADEQRSHALGWDALWDFANVEAAGSSSAKDVSRHALSVTLKDAQGAAIGGASVSISAFHNARAADVQTLTLREESLGQYGAPLITRRGLWRLQLTATRGNDRFLQTRVVEFDASGRLLTAAPSTSNHPNISPGTR